MTGASTRLLSWIVGVWACLTFSMGFAATSSFANVESPLVLDHEVYEELGERDQRETALRLVASEFNRRAFAAYDLASCAIAAAAVVVYLVSGRRSRIEAAILAFGVLVVLVSTFYVTPTLVDLGRQIDFVPREPSTPERTRFFSIHGADIVAELVKLGLLIFWSALLVFRPLPGGGK